MWDLKGKLVDNYSISEFETQGFTCFKNGKIKWQLGKSCIDYELLNYKKELYIRGPRGFIIYPEVKLAIPTKEEFENKVKNKKVLSQKEQFELHKRRYEPALNWLCIQYNGKEAFWMNWKRMKKKMNLICRSIDYIK
jgi:hypothetical protein